MKLLIKCGDHTDEFVIPEGSTVIGSRQDCRLTLAFPGVGPRHAQCYFGGTQHVTIKPLSSGYPVTVNGQEIEHADLHPYDEICLGEVTLTFTMESPRPEAATPDVAPPAEGASRGISFDEAPDDSAFEARPEGMDLVTVGKPGQSLPETTEGRPTELIHRDGRWILRDLVTGRETEITPGEARELEAQRAEAGFDNVEARPLPVEEATPNPLRRLLIPLVSVVGLAVLAVATMVILTRKDQEPAGRDLVEYQRSLRIGFAFLAQDDLEQATAHLKKGTAVLPESRLIQILLDIAELEAARGEDHRDYRWRSAENLYRELERDLDATAEMRSFAHDRLVFVRSFRLHEITFKQAEELVALGQFVKAYEKARQIPEDSVMLKQRGLRLNEVRQGAVAELLRRARSAMHGGKWDLAVKRAREAVDIDPNSTEAKRVLLQSQRAHLADARLAVAQGLLDAAEEMASHPAKELELLRKALAELEEESQRPVFERTPFESRGQNLLESIQSRIASFKDAKAASKVRQLFDQGQGEAALEILLKEKDSLPDSALGLQSTIGAVLRLASAATELDGANQYEPAREKWQRVVEKIPNEQNAYRRQAQERLTWYQENSGSISEECRKWALELTDDNPSKARELLKGALRWDPKNEEALAMVNALDGKALMHYRTGFAMRTRKDQQELAEARKHFELAIKYAEENSDTAIKARQELRKLGP